MDTFMFETSFLKGKYYFIKKFNNLTRLTAFKVIKLSIQINVPLFWVHNLKRGKNIVQNNHIVKKL